MHGMENFTTYFLNVMLRHASYLYFFQIQQAVSLDHDGVTWTKSMKNKLNLLYYKLHRSFASFDMFLMIFRWGIHFIFAIIN
jgi:hypothetical protein